MERLPHNKRILIDLDEIVILWKFTFKYQSVQFIGLGWWRVIYELEIDSMAQRYPPQHARVEAVVLQLGRTEPNGVFLLAEPVSGEDDGLLRVAFVLVPDQSQLAVLGHGVVGSDVTVEQGTLDPHRLAGKHSVPLQVHRPVDAAVHCRGSTV